MEFHTVAGNTLSVGAIVGAIVGWLPPAAALIAIVWYLIQIKESKTYQDWKASRRREKIAHLNAQLERLNSLNRTQQIAGGGFDGALK